jgi:hypothetical protein
MSEDTSQRVRETVEAVYHADSRRHWSNGPVMACLPIPDPGWFRPVTSGLLMACGAVPGSMRLVWNWPTNSSLLVQAGKNRKVEDDRLRLIFTCCHPACLWMHSLR